MHPPSSCQIIPNEPAVIPTHKKKPNSKRSLEPGGIDVNSTANGIILAKLNQALPVVVVFQ